MKNYKIAVADTGYVGLSLGVLISQKHQVVAVNIVQAKVDMISNKKSPIRDNDGCKGCILCMGLKDVVVSASPEGILVSDKEQSSYIKPYVNTLDHRVMFAEKSWGSFKVIDIDKASMTIKVTLNAGHQMNYHSHQHRDEVWTVIAGKGKTIVDGMEQNVKAGDVITMSAGCRHTVIAETELKLIEVQLGEAIDVHDKQKFELEY